MPVWFSLSVQRACAAAPAGIWGNVPPRYPYQHAPPLCEIMCGAALPGLSVTPQYMAGRDRLTPGAPALPPPRQAPEADTGSKPGSAQVSVSSGLTSSEGINLLYGPFFHNRRLCLRLLPNAAGQQHRRQNQSQYSPHGISLLFFFFLIIIIGKTGKCNKESSTRCAGGGAQ